VSWFFIKRNKKLEDYRKNLRKENERKITEYILKDEERKKIERYVKKYS